MRRSPAPDFDACRASGSRQAGPSPGVSFVGLTSIWSGTKTHLRRCTNDELKASRRPFFDRRKDNEYFLHHRRNSGCRCCRRLSRISCLKPVFLLKCAVERAIDARTATYITKIVAVDDRAEYILMVVRSRSQTRGLDILLYLDGRRDGASVQ
jgi:hypothetical protein